MKFINFLLIPSKLSAANTAELKRFEVQNHFCHTHSFLTASESSYRLLPPRRASLSLYASRAPRQTYRHFCLFLPQTLVFFSCTFPNRFAHPIRLNGRQCRTHDGTHKMFEASSSIERKSLNIDNLLNFPVFFPFFLCVSRVGFFVWFSLCFIQQSTRFFVWSIPRLMPIAIMFTVAALFFGDIFACFVSPTQNVRALTIYGLFRNFS